MQVKNPSIGVSKLPQLAAKPKAVRVGFGSIQGLRQDQASFRLESAMPSDSEFTRQFSFVCAPGYPTWLQQQIKKARFSNRMNGVREAFSTSSDKGDDSEPIGLLGRIVEVVASIPMAYNALIRPDHRFFDTHQSRLTSLTWKLPMAELSAGTPEKGLLHFKEALELDPVETETYARLADFALRVLLDPKLSEAKKQEAPYEQILKVAAYRASMLGAISKHARAPLREANWRPDRHQPQPQLAKLVLGRYHAYKGNYDQAITNFKAYIAEDEAREFRNGNFARAELMEVYLRSGKLQEAADFWLASMNKGQSFAKPAYLPLLQVLIAKHRAETPDIDLGTLQSKVVPEMEQFFLKVSPDAKDIAFHHEKFVSDTKSVQLTEFLLAEFLRDKQ